MIMKKGFKRMVSILAAAVMCLGMCLTGFAADGDYTITIENATVGETYSAYKIFDATYDETSGGVSYTISTDSPLYDSISGLNVFDLKAATTDADTYYVTVKDGVTDAQVIAAIESLDIENLITASASETASGTTLTLDVGEPGYYYVTTTTGSAVTITTAAPTATVIDKNEVVGEDFYKYIVDNRGNKLQYVDAALGAELDFDISSSVPRYEGSKPVIEYEFTDTLSDTGMEIKISASSDDIYEKDDHYYANEDLIDQFITFTDSTGNTYTLSDVAYNYTLEFTDVIYDKDAGCYVCSGFILTYYTYADESLSDSNYPTDLTIDITYTAYMTDDGNHFESNTAVLRYWVMDPDDTPTPGTNSGTTSTDYVYNWDLKILKIDGTETTKFLEGATFTLYGTSLIDVNVRTEYTYKLITAAEMEPGITYYYLLTDGRWITTGPTSATRGDYDPINAGPYERHEELFEIKNAGTDFTVEGTTNRNGVVIFDGLSAGTYTITEIVAPNGYNLLESPITITVAFDSDTGEFSVADTFGVLSSVSFDVNNELEIRILNNTGTRLPSTGGIGTTIFYVVGSILVLVAAAFIVARMRLGKTE